MAARNMSKRIAVLLVCNLHVGAVATACGSSVSQTTASAGLSANLAPMLATIPQDSKSAMLSWLAPATFSQLDLMLTGGRLKPTVEVAALDAHYGTFGNFIQTVGTVKATPDFPALLASVATGSKLTTTQYAAIVPDLIVIAAALQVATKTTQGVATDAKLGLLGVGSSQPAAPQPSGMPCLTPGLRWAIADWVMNDYPKNSVYVPTTSGEVESFQDSDYSKLFSYEGNMWQNESHSGLSEDGRV